MYIFTVMVTNRCFCNNCFDCYKVLLLVIALLFANVVLKRALIRFYSHGKIVVFWLFMMLLQFKAIGPIFKIIVLILSVNVLMQNCRLIVHNSIILFNKNCFDFTSNCHRLTFYRNCFARYNNLLIRTIII